MSDSPGDADLARTPGDGPFGTADSVRASHLLLNHAVERGLEVPDETITALTQAKHKLDDGWTPKVETEFWIAFRELARIAGPTSVSTLKATSDDHGSVPLVKRVLGARRRVSAARQLVSRYRIFSLLTLILLLVVQILWLIGSAVTKELDEKIPAEFEEISRDLASIEVELAALGRSSEEPGAKEKRERLKNRKTSLEQDDRSLGLREAAAKKLLRTWNATWRLGLSGGGGGEIADDLVEVEAAKFALQAMQQYLLPLLYGTLGAFAFVLRKLALEVKSYSFSADQETWYALRLQLGALAGLAVGWFIDPGSTQTFASLSALALAFLAGYSVDLLFAAADRLLGAFAQDEETAAKG